MAVKIWWARNVRGQNGEKMNAWRHWWENILENEKNGDQERNGKKKSLRLRLGDSENGKGMQLCPASSSGLL
jgi:hypothetical protein